jgi:L-asparaginase II
MPTPTLPHHIPLAITRRGGHIENVYYGSYAVVDAKGQLLAHAGDVETPMFTRSSLKPFQALPLVSHPQFDSLALSAPEIALTCASHNGEDRHAERAKAMLARASLSDAALQCGRHTPYWYEATSKTVPTGQTWSALQHNCSGKHAGFLLLNHLLASEAKNYLVPTARVQLQVRTAVAYAAGFGDDDQAMPWGIDGCSAPNFALPLRALARAFAWLSVDAADGRYGIARQTLYNAMRDHPEMVSGEGRNDLALAAAGRGLWVNKIGAEAVQTLGSREHGIGIALKMSEGNKTAMMIAFGGVLRALGLLDEHAKKTLAPWIELRLQSIAGAPVGAWESLV